jgi:hypothetical protein
MKDARVQTKVIRAKVAGVCCKCGAQILVGDKIRINLYPNRPSMAQHEACDVPSPSITGGL